MKPFSLSRDMMNMLGHFYPTGHILAAFPSEQAARDALKAIKDAGGSEDEIYWLTPEDIAKLAGGMGTSATALPAAGTEADTVRGFMDLGSQGHYALLIPSPDDDRGDRITEALKGAKPSYAQRYSKLIIEDLVT